MAVKFNPFTAQLQLDQVGAGGGGGASYIDGEAATYNDLPLDGSASLNSAWLVREASGTWLLSRKPAGIYIRTATAGVSRDADYTYAGILPDVFSDANFTLYDDADSTKNAKFQLSGITSGATRTIGVPDKNITLDDAGDTRPPASHTHGNITNAGLVGTTANLPLKTGTGGIVEAGVFGTGAGEFSEGNHTHELTALDATGATNGHVLTAQGDGTAAFAAASGGGATGAAPSASDVLGVSGSNITGQDAGSDKLVFWDDSASALKYLTAGSGLTITDDTITASGGIGGSTGSTDNAIIRASGTGGSEVQSSAIVIEDAVVPFSITGDASTDIITAVGHNFTTNQGVRFPTLTGGSGLNTTTTYFVRDISGDTFKVSTTSGGAAVNFTTNITAGTVIAMQANVAIVNNSSETTSALVLTPKGDTAAVILGPRPDGTAVGGNPRGAYAVDLQLRRGNATNVASGGESALLGGRQNTASGANGVVIGGTACTAGPNDASAVIVSNNSTASGAGAIVLTGNISTASGTRAIAIGEYCLADRANMIAHTAFVPASAGQTQAAKFPLWGRFISRTATGEDVDDVVDSTGHGFSANQSVRFLTKTGGSNLSTGTSYFVRDVTTNSFKLAATAGGAALNFGSDITAATIAGDELSNNNSATGRITIPSGKGFACIVQVMGNKSDGTTHCHFVQRYMLKNVGGTTSEVTAAETLGTNTTNGVSLFIAADDNSDSMTVKVEIPSGETWRFAGYVDAVEVAYGT